MHENIPSKIIIECVVGSTVHGTSVSDGLEDLDLMAVVIEDQATFCGFEPKESWSFRTKPMGVRSEAGDVDFIAYGLRKYLRLALKGNPSILLALFTPPDATRILTAEGQALRDLAGCIASKAAFAPFLGYMRQQHERLMGARGQKNVTRPELVEAYGFDTKYAAHVVRLGIQGAEFLRTGHITLPMPEADRQLCLAMRTGKFSLEEASEQITIAEQRLKNAHEASPLPDEPDTGLVERWMNGIYLDHWSGA